MGINLKSAAEFMDAFRTTTGSKVLLDCREPSETSEGAIQNAILIPLAQIATRANEIASGAHVFVYCRSGGRAQVASATLKDHGFQNITVAVNSGYEQLKPLS